MNKIEVLTDMTTADYLLQRALDCRIELSAHDGPNLLMGRAKVWAWEDAAKKAAHEIGIAPTLVELATLNDDLATVKQEVAAFMQA